MAPARNVAGGLCAVVVAGAVALVSFAPREGVVNAQAVAATASPATKPPNPSEDIASFVERFGRLRHNDESVLPEMHAIADRLAAQGRSDLGTGLAYYEKMSPEERMAGLAAEAKYDKLRTRLLDAERGDLRGSAWADLRDDVLASIASLLEETKDRIDTAPAARTLALRAHIHFLHACTDDAIDEDRRQDLIENAEADASKALDLFQRVGLLTPQLEPLLVTACLEYSKGHVSQAAAGFQDVLDLAAHVSNVKYQLLALEDLLHLAKNAGDVERRGELVQAMARLDSPATNWTLAWEEAQLLLDLDQAEGAANFLVRNKPTSPEALEQWHVMMGAVLRRSGKAAIAKQHIDAVAESATPFANLDFRVADADALLEDGNPAAALNRLGDYADFAKAAARSRANFLRIRGAAQLALRRLTEARATLEDCLALGEGLENTLHLASSNGDSSSVFGEALTLEMVALLARAHAQSGDSLAAALAIEDRQSRTLRTGLARSSLPTLGISDMTAWANSCELGLVTWVIGGDSSVVVHVGRAGDAHAEVLNLRRREVDEAVRRLREATISGNSIASALAVEIQSAILPASIVARLAHPPSAEGARLLILAHGPLERLPFDVLPLFSGARENTIVPLVLPGLPEELPGIPIVPSMLAAWNLLGDPHDGNDAVLLPGAGSEIDTIAALRRQSRVWVGRAFDHDALDEALHGSAALHVATHLRANAASGDSRLAHAGLELSNGQLYGVEEIRRARPALPLAFLSACETGSGQFIDAQAARGVARAFLESGTRNLVVTLWPVGDSTARTYAVAFHRALLLDMLPSRAALAAREVLRAGGASPADWAAFRLLGRD